MESAEMPCFPAISLILSTLCGSQETRIRLASSPNRTNSGTSPYELRSTCAPMPRAKPHSARVTAKPPSEQSLADSTSPSPIISTIAFCRPLPCSSSSDGGKPQTWPRISLAYSDEPNSASTSEASPGSRAAQHDQRAPALRKCGPTALCTSSMMPTTPITGVG